MRRPIPVSPISYPYPHRHHPALSVWIVPALRHQTCPTSFPGWFLICRLPFNGFWAHSHLPETFSSITACYLSLKDFLSVCFCVHINVHIRTVYYLDLFSRSLLGDSHVMRQYNTWHKVRTKCARIMYLSIFLDLNKWMDESNLGKLAPKKESPKQNSYFTLL